jgi:hypothetical protein
MFDFTKEYGGYYKLVLTTARQLPDCVPEGCGSCYIV